MYQTIKPIVALLKEGKGPVLMFIFMLIILVLMSQCIPDIAQVTFKVAQNSFVTQ